MAGESKEIRRENLYFSQKERIFLAVKETELSELKNLELTMTKISKIIGYEQAPSINKALKALVLDEEILYCDNRKKYKIRNNSDADNFFEKICEKPIIIYEDKEFKGYSLDKIMEKDLLLNVLPEEFPLQKTAIVLSVDNKGRLNINDLKNNIPKMIKELPTYITDAKGRYREKLSKFIDTYLSNAFITQIETKIIPYEFNERSNEYYEDTYNIRKGDKIIISCPLGYGKTVTAMRICKNILRDCAYPFIIKLSLLNKDLDHYKDINSLIALEVGLSKKAVDYILNHGEGMLIFDDFKGLSELGKVLDLIEKLFTNYSNNVKKNGVLIIWDSKEIPVFTTKINFTAFNLRFETESVKKIQKEIGNNFNKIATPHSCRNPLNLELCGIGGLFKDFKGRCIQSKLYGNYLVERIKYCIYKYFNEGKNLEGTLMFPSVSEGISILILSILSRLIIGKEGYRRTFSKSQLDREITMAIERGKTILPFIPSEKEISKILHETKLLLPIDNLTFIFEDKSSEDEYFTFATSMLYKYLVASDVAKNFNDNPDIYVNLIWDFWNQFINDGLNQEFFIFLFGLVKNPEKLMRYLREEIENSSPLVRPRAELLLGRCINDILRGNEDIIKENEGVAVEVCKFVIDALCHAKYGQSPPDPYLFSELNDIITHISQFKAQFGDIYERLENDIKHWYGKYPAKYVFPKRIEGEIPESDEELENKLEDIDIKALGFCRETKYLPFLCNIILKTKNNELIRDAVWSIWRILKQFSEIDPSETDVTLQGLYHYLAFEKRVIDVIFNKLESSFDITLFIYTMNIIQVVGDKIPNERIPRTKIQQSSGELKESTPTDQEDKVKHYTKSELVNKINYFINENPDQYIDAGVWGMLHIYKKDDQENNTAEYLDEILKNNNIPPTARGLAAFGIGKNKIKSRKGTLRKIIKNTNEDDFIREDCIWALGQIGETKEDFHILTDTLKSPDCKTLVRIRSSLSILDFVKRNDSLKRLGLQKLENILKNIESTDFQFSVEKEILQYYIDYTKNALYRLSRGGQR